MARLRQDRLQVDKPEIVLALDSKGRVIGNVGRAFAMVEKDDVVECPLIVNGVEEARLRWVVTAKPNRRGVAYLRLVASDDCKLTKLKRDPEVG